MNMQVTGQSEELGNEVDKNGELNADANANAGSEQGHEGEQNGDQGQSKTQNRKARLRRKLQESEIARQKLEEDNRNLHAKVDTLATQVEGVLNPPMQRPSRVNYESEEDYEDDLLKWSRQENKSQSSNDNGAGKPAAEAAPAAAPASAPAPAGQPRLPQETVDNWLDNCDNAADKYEDFDEVLNNTSTPITPVMADTMMENDAGAEVAYHLGKNPAEAARIAKMSLVQQVNEIQQLASKFAPSISNAPDPIDPPKGGTDDNYEGEDPEKMSPKRYREWRRSQKAKK